jgi:isopentenyl-diphosphate Delta-isomerase
VITQRKLRHVEACLAYPVEYQTRTTGFECLDLPYRALPATDLSDIDTSVEFLGRTLQAPVLIGAMTGGTDLSATINRNLATAAQRLGLGMMLGSQRVMLEKPSAVNSFAVRRYAPDVLLIGNLGVAQLNKGYGAGEIVRAVETVDADALALHANPLQEALQADGDTDFTSIGERLGEIVPQVPYPVLLKEVGHGLSAAVAREVADVGLAALDVAGAGGTSWGRVEEFVRYGHVRHPELAEWGIPTATALRQVHAELPGMPLVASGGIRSGLDAAKALAMGAQVVAVARPLLAPALCSSDRVGEWLTDFLEGLRVAMHCAGAPDVITLRDRALGPRG